MRVPHEYPTILLQALCRGLSKNFTNSNDFKIFKKDCDKTGTTEEALANAEKFGFDTKLFADHPFLPGKKIPIYFAARDISQLKPGDSGFASVIGFNRTQFGGIKLKIDGRENLSTISEDITSRLGLQGFSKDIGSNFISPTLAIASLKLSDPFDKKNPYEWTLVSSTRPELNLGDKLDVEVVVRRDSPISFVIPALKGLLGITPEPPKSVKPKAKQL